MPTEAPAAPPPAPAAPPSTPNPPAKESASAPPPPALDQTKPFADTVSAPMRDVFSKMQAAADKDDEPKSKIKAPAKSPEPKQDGEPKQPKESQADENEDPEADDEAPKEQQADKTDKTPPEKTDAKEGKKLSPWKLVDQYKNEVAQHKAKLAEFERQLAEAKAKPPEDPEKKQLAEKLSSFEKRAQELENELRFVNYQKHPEFVEKFQKPYEEAWGKAVKRLSGIQVPQDDGTTRDLGVQDIAQLANLDPAKARQLVRKEFPDDAAEILTHVNQIRDLAEAQQKALEEARTKGAERDKQRQEQWQAQAKKLQDEVETVWNKHNGEGEAQYEFLKPVDGQDDRNERLEKAKKFVTAAFQQNPMDPALSPEQRAEIVKRHSAIRNRAIGFSVLKYENKALQARIEELTKELAEFKDSTPPDGEPKHSATEPTDAMGGALSTLASMAV